MGDWTLNFAPPSRLFLESDTGRKLVSVPFFQQPASTLNPNYCVGA